MNLNTGKQQQLRQKMPSRKTPPLLQLGEGKTNPVKIMVWYVISAKEVGSL